MRQSRRQVEARTGRTEVQESGGVALAGARVVHVVDLHDVPAADLVSGLLLIRPVESFHHVPFKDRRVDRAR